MQTGAVNFPVKQHCPNSPVQFGPPKMPGLEVPSGFQGVSNLFEKPLARVSRLQGNTEVPEVSESPTVSGSTRMSRLPRMKEWTGVSKLPSIPIPKILKSNKEVCGYAKYICPFNMTDEELSNAIFNNDTKCHEKIPSFKKSIESKCFLHVEWNITAPIGYGIAIQFEDLSLDWYEDEINCNSKISFWDANGTELRTINKKISNFEHSGYNMSPLLTKTNHVIVHFLTWRFYPTRNQSSFFRLSFKALPVDNIPRVLTDFDLHQYILEVTTMGSDPGYDCADIDPLQLPAVIRCDGVTHCLGGEDEQNCQYATQGCG